MPATYDLIGPTAVVTGASSGIGRAIAVGLAAAGADVVGVHKGPEAAGDGVRRDIEALGRRAIVFPGDTGDPATAERCLDEALRLSGTCDIWVNNAAALMVKPVLDTADDDWHGLLAANLHGYFYGCRAALRAMTDQRRGSIINISSAADILAVANLSAYITAKGGIVGMTKTIAVEAAPHGVTCNAVAPGAVETPLNADAYTDQVRATYERRIPLGRIGAPEEIADVVVFLASQGARYLTGQEVVVDGGLVVDGTVGHAIDP